MITGTVATPRAHEEQQSTALIQWEPKLINVASKSKGGNLVGAELAVSSAEETHQQRHKEEVSSRELLPGMNGGG